MTIPAVSADHPDRFAAGRPGLSSRQGGCSLAARRDARKFYHTIGQNSTDCSFVFQRPSARAAGRFFSFVSVCRGPPTQIADKAPDSLAEFAPTCAKKVSLFGRNSFLPKYCSRSGLCEVVVTRRIAPHRPKGQSSDIRLLLLSKRKQRFRLEKEDENKRVDFSPPGGKRKRAIFLLTPCTQRRCKPSQLGAQRSGSELKSISSIPGPGRSPPGSPRPRWGSPG